MYDIMGYIEESGDELSWEIRNEIEKLLDSKSDLGKQMEPFMKENRNLQRKIQNLKSQCQHEHTYITGSDRDDFEGRTYFTYLCPDCSETDPFILRGITRKLKHNGVFSPPKQKYVISIDPPHRFQLESYGTILYEDEILSDVIFFESTFSLYQLSKIKGVKKIKVSRTGKLV